MERNRTTAPVSREHVGTRSSIQFYGKVHLPGSLNGFRLTRRPRKCAGAVWPAAAASRLPCPPQAFKANLRYFDGCFSTQWALFSLMEEESVTHLSSPITLVCCSPALFAKTTSLASLDLRATNPTTRNRGCVMESADYQSYLSSQLHQWETSSGNTFSKWRMTQH